MKAILVIDMPISCRDCPCGDYNICSVLQKTHTDKMNNQREAWCPLKPMPRKNQGRFFHSDLGENTYKCGWNACLEEIEK